MANLTCTPDNQQLYAVAAHAAKPLAYDPTGYLHFAARAGYDLIILNSLSADFLIRCVDFVACRGGKFAATTYICRVAMCLFRITEAFCFADLAIKHPDSLDTTDYAFRTSAIVALHFAA